MNTKLQMDTLKREIDGLKRKLEQTESAAEDALQKQREAELRYNEQKDQVRWLRNMVAFLSAKPTKRTREGPHGMPPMTEEVYTAPYEEDEKGRHPTFRNFNSPY